MQTLSRVFQDLRDENILFFIGDGRYLLADSPISAEAETLPNNALDFAVQNRKLTVSNLPTNDPLTLARQRRD